MARGRTNAGPGKLWSAIVSEVTAVAMALAAWRSANDAECETDADMLYARAVCELEKKLAAHVTRELVCTRRHHRCCRKRIHRHVAVEQPAV